MVAPRLCQVQRHVHYYPATGLAFALQEQSIQHLRMLQNQIAQLEG